MADITKLVWRNYVNQFAVFLATRLGPIKTVR